MANISSFLTYRNISFLWLNIHECGLFHGWTFVCQTSTCPMVMMYTPTLNISASYFLRFHVFVFIIGNVFSTP